MKSIRSVRLKLCAALLGICVGWVVPPGGFSAAHASEGGGETPADTLAPKKPASAAAKPPVAAGKPAAAAPRVSRPASVVRVAPVRRSLPRESAPSGLPPAGETRFAEDQVIVRYRLSARQGDMDAAVRRLNLRHVEGRTFALAGTTAHLYAIADGRPVGAVIADLEADPTVVYAQPNYLYSLLQGAGAAGSQYALEKMAIFAAHELATGEGVAVAVIDSLIDPTHPEFSKASIELIDATGGASGAAHEHGTSIAGVIASRGTLTGVAPDARLMGVRAFLEDDRGAAHGTSWRVSTALDRAHAAGARVVNMSFAGPEDPLLARSVAGLLRRGAIAVAAAGNEGPDAPPLYPAAYPGVIAVTAVDKENLIYGRASRGAHIAVAAPGVDILTPVPKNGYQVASGTSLAAAHISGLAALVLSRSPSLNAADVLEILLSSTTAVGESGRNPVFGAGLPDALTAIRASAARKQ